MSSAMLDAQTRQAVQQFADKLVGHYRVVGVLVFGSRARKSHRQDSDADVAVILRGPKGAFLDTKLGMADLAYEVLLETGVLIQPLPVWEEEWAHPETFTNPALLLNISREGVRL